MKHIGMRKGPDGGKTEDRDGVRHGLVIIGQKTLDQGYTEVLLTMKVMSLSVFYTKNKYTDRRSDFRYEEFHYRA